MNQPFEALSITALVSITLSLVFEMFPKAKNWFDLTFNSRQKQIVVAMTVFVITLVVGFAQCYIRQICPADWYEFFWQTLLTFFGAAGVQQGVYRLIREPDQNL